MFEVRGLRAGYRPGVTVIEDVDLTVDDGQAVGVIGRNGAGKTCLAQALSGTLKATAGTITLDGTELTGRDTRGRVRARLSHVPEGRLVFKDLTVQENLEMAAYGAGLKLTPDRLDAVRETFPILADKATHRAGGMSGGEQQWLAIGRALVQEPRAIVLDEPSLGLSPVAIDALGVALVEIRERGAALVLMEQNPNLLRRVCNEVLLLDQGRVGESLDGEAGEKLVAEAYFGG
ncbi:MAG: ABC transporter ATP-binding protein [Solirubrobacteraceae bacterium]